MDVLYLLRKVLFRELFDASQSEFQPASVKAAFKTAQRAVPRGKAEAWNVQSFQRGFLLLPQLGKNYACRWERRKKDASFYLAAEIELQGFIVLHRLANQVAHSQRRRRPNPFENVAAMVCNKAIDLSEPGYHFAYIVMWARCLVRH